MKKIIICIFLLFPLFLFAQFTPNYKSDLNQKLLDLSNDYVILNINLKPGDEDINALSNLRFLEGYKVFNLFFTRGEIGNDLFGESFGEKLSVILSQKANTLSKSFDIENYYLNLKNNTLLNNSAEIINGWGGQDSVVYRFKKILNLIKPDIILISGAYDKEYNLYDVYYKAMTDIVIKTVSDTTGLFDNKSLAANNKKLWKVQKVLARLNCEKDQSNDELKFEVQDKYQIVFDLYKKLYSDQSSVVSELRELKPSYYKELFRSVKVLNSKNDIKSGIIIKYSEKEKIDKIVKNLLDQRNLKKNQFLQVVQKTDQVIDVMKNSYRRIEPVADRIISKIKFDLSEIRFNLLGIKINKYLSDSAVCRRQIFKFFVDSIENMKPGKTSIVFYNVDDTNWVIMRGNDIGKSYNMIFREPFVFVTPDQLPLNFPQNKYQYDFMTETPIFNYAIIHQASDPNYSFQYFGREYLNSTEKAEFSILPDKKFIQDKVVLDFNVTHFLNDPYKNIMPRLLPQYSGIGNFMATKFSVFKKYDVIHGKIQFTLNDTIKDGIYNVGFTIGEPMISTIKLHKFNLVTDTTKTIGLFSKSGDILTEFLKSTNQKFILNPSPDLYGKLHSVIIDENYLEFGNAEAMMKRFEKFIIDGISVVMLGQSIPAELEIFGKSISNEKTLSFTIRDTILIPETGDPIFNHPNKINNTELNNWDYEIGKSIPEKYDSSFIKLLEVKSAKNNAAGIIQLKREKASFYYLPLSIKKQLSNVNSGIYKLLTNLILN